MDITEIYNYDVSGGNKTFDKIVLPAYSGYLTIQAKFRSLSANDATLELKQSLNGLNFDDIKDGAGNKAIVTLDNTTTEYDETGALTASATINIGDLKTLYLRPILTVNSVLTGTFVGIKIITC